jgi:O-antigen/teichoic acid export membrane protein
MDLVGGAISQVFYQRAAAARVAGQLAEVVEGTYRRLVTIGFAPTVVLGIVASDLFRFAFGARWVEAGVYTQILSPWTLFWFVSSPLSSLFSVLERQEFGLKLNVRIFGTRFLSLAAGGLTGDARVALMLFAGSGVFVYGYFSFAILAAAGVPVWVELLVAGLSLAAFFFVAVRRDPALMTMVKSARLSGS